MSDSENDDDDYCPTVNDEKMFNQEVGENDNNDENNKTGMTQAESEEADEILKSFKLNLPINEKSLEKKKQVVNEVKSYDFAGETVQIDEKTGLEHSVDIPTYQKRCHIPRRRKVSGLDMILSGKKPKLSLIKKTKLDWTAHKKRDGLETELNNVSKSKKSKVERDDFLARTDYRTFERERDERLKRINNRKLTS